MSHARFHLAFPVHDLVEARAFYGDLLGCSEGRSAPRWVDFDFWGNQITAHLVETTAATCDENAVDGDEVPARHFGAILPWATWHDVRDRLLSRVTFRIHPRIRFAGEVGEQATMFFDDPSGNVIELKAFKDEHQIFAR